MGRIKQVEHYELTKASLGYLVELLTSLSLPFPPSDDACSKMDVNGALPGTMALPHGIEASWAA